jgi:hypothetical protein
VSGNHQAAGIQATDDRRRMTRIRESSARQNPPPVV